MIACIEMLLNHNDSCRPSILNTVGILTSEKSNKDLGVSIGSICDILMHLINAEDYWILLFRNVNGRELNPKDCSDVDSIARIWSEVESATKEFLENQTERTLQVVRNVTWNDITIHFTFAKILIHTATHETYNRGLIIGLIRQHEHEPLNVGML